MQGLGPQSIFCLVQPPISTKTRQLGRILFHSPLNLASRTSKSLTRSRRENVCLDLGTTKQSELMLKASILSLLFLIREQVSGRPLNPSVSEMRVVNLSASLNLPPTTPAMSSPTTAAALSSQPTKIMATRKLRHFHRYSSSKLAASLTQGPRPLDPGPMSYRVSSEHSSYQTKSK